MLIALAGLLALIFVEAPGGGRGPVVFVGIELALLVIGGTVIVAWGERRRIARERALAPILQALGFARSAVPRERIATSRLPLFADSRKPWLQRDWLGSGSECSWRGHRAWFFELSRSDEQGVEYPADSGGLTAGTATGLAPRSAAWARRSWRRYRRGGWSHRQSLSCLVVETLLDAAPTVLGSRRDLLPFAASFEEVEFESQEFNDAVVVLTGDAHFAHALVDQRAMDRLLAQPLGRIFEVAGPWALLCTTQCSPEAVEDLLNAAVDFVEAIPRAVESMWPATVREAVAG